MKDKKILLVEVLSIIFLVLVFWGIQVSETEASFWFGCQLDADLSGCKWKPADLSLAACEAATEKWCMVNPAGMSPLGTLVAVNSCDTGNRHCRKDNCAGIAEPDGTPCGAAVGKGGGAPCNTNPQATGVWDASESQCIQCSGQREDKLCGSTTTISVTVAGCGAGDTLLESACGASATCDELAVGAACSPPVGGTCNAVGVCGVGGPTCAAGDGCLPGCVPPDPDCAAPATSGIIFLNPSSINDLMELVDAIVNFLFYIAIPLAILLLVIAGFLYLTAGGDAQKVNTARTLVFYVLLGLIIIFLAKAIAAVIEYAVS